MSWKSFVVLIAALVAGVAVSALEVRTAEAALPRPDLLKGKFGRKRFKAKSSLVAYYVTSTQGLQIVGVTVTPTGSQTTATLTAGGVPDLATANYPLTLTGVVGTFSAISLRGGKAWTAEGTMSIVLTSFDPSSGRLTATFGGTMEPGDTTPGNTITVKGGKLSVEVDIL